MDRRLAARAVQGRQELGGSAQEVKRSKRRFKASIHYLIPWQYIKLFESYPRRCHDLVKAQTPMGRFWFSRNLWRSGRYRPAETPTHSARRRVAMRM